MFFLIYVIRLLTIINKFYKKYFKKNCYAYQLYIIFKLNFNILVFYCIHNFRVTLVHDVILVYVLY